ncbi:MAG: response regulator [Acidobacteriota bacterium]|nr:MAG: response regulator [Acidobacteriota bacterium]
MSGEKLKILLVEDDPLQAEIIGAMLSSGAPDIAFEKSYSLEETLSRIREGAYDLLLLDLELPDCEGFETFERVHAAARRIPIVVLTATGNESVARETMRGGAQDYLIKWEMDQHLLVRTIRYAIARMKSDERLKLALDAAGMGICELEIPKNVISCDEKAAAMFGVSEGDLDQIVAIIHSDDQARFRQLIDQVVGGTQSQGEFRAGQSPLKWIEFHARLIDDGDKAPERVLFAVRDITDKKKFETELYRAQRLESIGALASGIAHDLNNVMAPIFMALHTLQQRFTDENSQRWLSLVYKSAERGRDLIQQMVTFAKGTGGKQAPLQLRPLVADLENILAETLPSNVALRVEIPESPWTIIGDVTQLHQILINLSINARDAMPEGGTLTIRIENVGLKDEDVNRFENAAPGNYVRITVADTGMGIPPRILDRIFDPFFTTKEKGLGSGLGLSIVLGIVRGYGGFVTVESEVGAGTTFHIHLPAQTTVWLDAVSALTPVAGKGRGETILVVDDEEYICEVVKYTLESNGYKALVASDVEEAIILFQQNRDAIKLVLTDLELPNRDGLDTIREIKQQAPDIVIIATSGTRTTDKLIMAQQAGINSFLTKPFTAEKLLGALTSFLRDQGEAA